MNIESGAALLAATLLAISGAEQVWAAELPQTEASAQAPDAVIAPDVIQAEFADLYATLQASHYDLFARTSRADYDAMFARMRAEIDRPMTRAEIAARFQGFMAFGQIAHARIDAAGDSYAAYRAAGGRAFPLGIRVADGRLFIADNGSGLDTLAAGDEILSINGRPTAFWLDSAARQLSADTPYMLGAMLEWSFRRVVWSEIGDVAAFDVRLRRADGELVSVAIPALSPADLTAARAGQPPRLELSWENREARMLDGGVAYLRPGPTYNAAGEGAAAYDNTTFRTFIDEAFAGFIAAGATDLIIDLRDNPGGDNSFSDILIAWIATRPFRFTSDFRIKVSPATVASNAERLSVPGNDPTGVSARMAVAYEGVAAGEVIAFTIAETRPREGRRFTGRVHALINRHSYSNTVAMAATIQDYGFGQVMGEETSDLATTYGAMETFALPRTGIVVGYPKAFIVRPNGGLEARGVVPDVAIVTPVVETPDDPVLRQALALIGAAH
jgi:hypothetical protein